MSLTYQLTAYDWSSFHWENRWVSKHAKTKVNHVGLRINQMEILATRNGARLLPYSRIERAFNKPLFMTSPKLMTLEAWKKCIPIVHGYGIIHPWKCVLYHFTGGILPAPRSCTDLIQRCLTAIGEPTNEKVYPHLLLKEYYQCK